MQQSLISATALHRKYKVEEPAQPDRGGDPPATNASASVADVLANLAALHRSGALSDEEFKIAKQRLLLGD